GRSAKAMPLRASSRCSALVSETEPSPGAPVTLGTMAVMGPLPLMLAVAAGAAAGVGFAAAPEDESAAVLTGSFAEVVFATAASDCIQVAISVAVLPVIDCITSGVTAVQGSRESVLLASSSPVMRWTRLPVGSVTSQMYDTLVPFFSFA